VTRRTQSTTIASTLAAPASCPAISSKRFRKPEKLKVTIKSLTVKVIEGQAWECFVDRQDLVLAEVRVCKNKSKGSAAPAAPAAPAAN
jgi:hypothetical protein